MSEKYLTLIFRKRLPQFNSIEEIFLQLLEQFKKQLDVHHVEVPNSGADPLSACKNLHFIHRNKSNINHITGHINYGSLALGKKGILTIHDIGSAFYGGSIHKLYIRIFWFWLPALMVRKITVISHFSKKELSELIPFAKNKIVVIHNPVNSALQYCPKPFNKENPLVLHIGTKSNKNLERTIEALEGIKCRFLVIGELSQRQLALLENNRIDYYNRMHISFTEIKAAYEECDLVSFVSLYEGFGMPVIEAQAVGRPVLTSAIEPLKEVAGDAACMVNPTEVRDIRKGLLRIMKEGKYREELVRKGQENVKRFQLKNIADQYLALYKEITNA
ncbi:glycosyltransferase involved in cell wall biosynthesis [Gramella sp. Hel_I_59]|uniref:glycosyltransferase family 4 protein n=1 Tax=Gramella sp. Hel_I_59 TaxID=1249978 RepID=UPI001150165A|nr:glycosyltransferase family 1 protein [Gramella sp. Hel_I_59]TQI71937.1 glycosyltransferase involved in cell wall biosynthesis [Gramella sp. Hel_I_59]